MSDTQFYSVLDEFDKLFRGMPAAIMRAETLLSRGARW
jgi:hypothetical protein